MADKIGNSLYNLGQDTEPHKIVPSMSFAKEFHHSFIQNSAPPVLNISAGCISFYFLVSFLDLVQLGMQFYGNTFPDIIHRIWTAPGILTHGVKVCQCISPDCPRLHIIELPLCFSIDQAHFRKSQDRIIDASSDRYGRDVVNIYLKLMDFNIFAYF